MNIFHNLPVTKKFYACVLPCLLCLLALSVEVKAQRMENHSTVIVKIPEMTEEQYQGILDGISKDNQFTFEYSCKESNIVIVKYYHRHHERADVRVAATTSFRKWGKVTKIEVIYSDFMKGASGKC